MFVQLSYVQVWKLTNDWKHIYFNFEAENTFKLIDLLMLNALLQMQHDYILGNYPVGKDDAAQLSALQILAEIGFVSTPESCT